MYKNQRWITVGVLAFAVAVGTLQMTAVVPLLAVLQHELNVPLTSVSWVLTASLLAGTVAIPLFSRFGDRYGRRPVALSALGLLVVGSVVSALATTLPLIVAGRVLQGVATPLLALGIGIARETVSREQLPTAIGILSAMMGVGSGGGMILAGLVGGTHRGMFLILAGLGAIAFLLVAAFVREPSRERATGRPDFPGAVLVAGWLVGLLLAVDKGQDWGWGSPRVLGLLVGAVGLAAVWVFTARRTRFPLIEIPMLTHRGTIGANVASGLLGFALFAAITSISGVAQGELGASVLQVGLFLLPAAVLMLAVSLLAGPLMRRLTAANLVGAGSLTVAIGVFWLAAAHDVSGDLYGASAIVGLGIGLGYAALGTMAVQHVEPAKTAAAAGVNALVRTLGSSIAGTVAAILLGNDAIGWSFGIAAVAALLAAIVGFGNPVLVRVSSAVTA